MRLAVIASLLLLSSPAIAAEADQNENQPAKDKKICKDSGEQTASRMRKRVCKTAEEWENDRSGVSLNDLKRIGN